MTHHELTILKEEIKGLKATIQHHTKRKSIKRRYIRNTGILNAEQALGVEINDVEVEEEEDADTIVVVLPANQRCCRVCNQSGHNARTCIRS